MMGFFAYPRTCSDAKVFDLDLDLLAFAFDGLSNDPLVFAFKVGLGINMLVFAFNVG